MPTISDPNPAVKNTQITNGTLLTLQSVRPRIEASALNISESVLSCIGSTPLVRLDRLAKARGLKCNLLAKLEYYSAGGSVKDRIALRMVLEAEREGRLIPGKSVIIEPTSGNTGIGLALAAAVKGYRCIIVLPEKMSREKVNTMKALGAQIVRTPTEAASDSYDSNLSVAARLEKSIPGGIILNQYQNQFNPQSHYDLTGLEIIEAVKNSSGSAQDRASSGKVDVLVAGVGTGGTISGTSRRLKSHYGTEAVHTIGIDPVGSILAVPDQLNTVGVQAYKLEGTGYDFKPDTLHYDHIDQWLKIADEPAFAMLREVIKLEGILVGGSSGQAIAGMIEYLKSEEGWQKYGKVEGKNVVVICADSVRNYITKDWLIEGSEDLEITEESIIKQYSKPSQ